MFPLTHLSLKIFPNETAFDVVFIDSPIFNRNIVNGDLNMIQCIYSKQQLIPSNIEEKYVILLTNLFFTTMVTAATSDDDGSTRQRQ
jgi:hypothetical protein